MTSGGSLGGKLFVALTHLVPPLAPALWRWWYNTLVRKDAAGELPFMNYGYADDDPLPLAPADELYRYPIQLYRHVVARLDLAGHAVLEIGSGRGLVPATASGSKPGIPHRTGRCPARRRRVDRHRYRCRIATRVSGHEYFLSEVRRVLKPGGEFAFCDLRTPAVMADLHARWPGRAHPRAGPGALAQRDRGLRRPARQYALCHARRRTAGLPQRRPPEAVIP